MPITNNSAYMTIKKFISLIVLLLSLVAVQAAPTVGKTYRIVISSKSMFVKDASLIPNDVVLWSETNVPAQRWTLETATDGKYAFRNVYSGLYLAAKSTPASGVTLVQMPSSVKRTTGAWNIKPVEGLTNVYTISAGGNEGLCIGIDQAAADGNQLKLVEPATVEKANYVYCRIIESEVPTAFDAAVRDEMVQGFINQHYKEATGGHILGGGGWWGDAEMFEVILDAFETTGDKIYQTYFRELYNNFLIRNNSDWSYNEFNDDITWMVLACIRA